MSSQQHSGIPTHWVDLEIEGGLSAGDRGYLYGETLFETLRFHAGSLQLLDRHLARLARGCRVLGIAYPAERITGQLEMALVHLRACAVSDACLRLSISRGEAGRAYAAPAQCEPVLVCGLYPVDLPWRQAAESVAAIVCELKLSTQPALAGIKHGNRLEQVLAAGEVARSGVGDGVLCRENGRVSATVRGNLFAWDGRAWLTPPAVDCGIEGTVRDFLLTTLASRRNIIIREQSMTEQELHRMQALCSTNSLLGPRGIHSLGATQFEDGQAVAELQQAWFDCMEAAS